SRVQLEWEFDERARVVKIEVLQAPKPDDKDKKEDQKGEPKSGKAVGELTAKSDAKGNVWIEVKADGEEKARTYVLHQGGTKKLLQAISEVKVGSRVQVEWIFLERLRVVKLEVLKTR